MKDRVTQQIKTRGDRWVEIKRGEDGHGIFSHKECVRVSFSK